MYTLLVVDDDEIIREGIMKNIPWAAHGFEVVGEAANGAAGLEMVLKLAPQIVLTDIRMPFMDGLHMAEKMQELQLDTKVIFLTGYEDFSYVKKALSLKVSDFVLKYQDYDEIVSAVRSAAEEYETEKHKRESMERSVTLGRHQFYCDLLAGSLSQGNYARQLEHLQLSFSGPVFCTAVIHFDNTRGFAQSQTAKDMDLILFSVKNICDEVLQTFRHQGVCALFNGRVCLVFNAASHTLYTDGHLQEMLTEVRSHIETSLNIHVTIAAGSLNEGYTGVELSFYEALTVIGMKGMTGRTGIIFNENIGKRVNSHQSLLTQITEYIHRHYHREDLSLSEIAEEVHFSPAYISTLFKKYRSYNISDYLVDVRIQRARELLCTTDMKTYEVAERVGYSNPQYFSVLFKKHTGYAPTQFKTLQGCAVEPSEDMNKTNKL